jgi:basic membrane protein A and related proteins
VGTFGGLQVPNVTLYMKGFQAGVEYYNAQHKASIQVLGWDTKTDKGLFIGSLTDTGKAQAAAKSQIDSGADVIMPVAGLASAGGYAAVKAVDNVYAIGVDTDQCYSAPSACEVLLSSVEKEMDQAVIDTIEDLRNNKFEGGTNYVGNLKNGGVGLAPFNRLATKIPDGLKKELVQVRKDLIDGKIKTGVDPLK